MPTQLRGVRPVASSATAASLLILSTLLFGAKEIVAAAAAVAEAAGAVASATAGISTNPIFTIPLDKQYVPVLRNGAAVAHKTAYFGQLYLGAPSSQAFTVVFDTGSGHFFLPSSACKSETCAKHRRFDASASASVEHINHDGSAVGDGDSERDEVSVVYGTGEITGGFVRETVCLQNASSVPTGPADAGCTAVRIVLATEMTEEPFGSFNFDGVVGLGLDALSLDPEFSFFRQMMEVGGVSSARFGYFLSRDDSLQSEITFGGHDESRVASDLQWASVHRPELGYWQVKIRSISIGGRTLADCEDGSCSAIADTGTSLLGVPRGTMKQLHLHLARKVPVDTDELDCREFPGPDMVFELEGGVKIALGPEDYSRAAAVRVLQSSTQRAQVICRASLMPVDPDHSLGSKTWILGEPVLKKYYTAYDLQSKQVGFALAKQPSQLEIEKSVENHVVSGAPPREALKPAVVHI